MASTASKPMDASAPVFSYAQAAKGIAPKNDESVKKSEESRSASTSSTDRVATQTQPTEQHIESAAGEFAEENANESESQSRTLNGTPKPTASSTTSPSLGTASVTTLGKDEELVLLPNGKADGNWEKKSERSGRDGKQSRSEKKASKMEKGWRKEAEPKPELKVAPIPSVNIWQQRLSEAKAKVEITPKSQPVPAKPAAKTAASTPDTNKSSPKKKITTTNEGGEAQKESKKAIESKVQHDATKKPGVRGGRQARDADRDSVVPPPVGDDVAWPTPETAKEDEKKKPAEKAEKANGPGKTHGKEKWMPVPYVPTAVFVTPLPQAAQRRTPRPARGGREGQPRGGQIGYNATNGERPAPSNVSSKPLENNRAEQANISESVNAGADLINKPERKPTVNGADKFKVEPKLAKAFAEETSNNAEKAAAVTNGASESQSKPKPEGRPVIKDHDIASLASRFEGSRFSATSEPFTQSKHTKFDRQQDGQAKSAEGHRETAFSPRDRDFPKDREHTRERGEPRSDRGRGGYRGRGGHSTYNPSASHYTAQSVPQIPGSFASKPFQYGERQRQPSQTPHNGPPRGAARSQSIISPPMFYQNHGPPAQPMSPVHPDMGMYGYPPMQQPMMMPPFQPYVDSYPVISMLTTQLNYYFSVDNLCRDMFLRKHMDSQGFVPLAVIAGFRRVKSLTENLDLVRDVCQNLEAVEFWPAADGNDKLRRRGDWEQWVLAVDMREPAAQVEGPGPRAQAHSYQNGYQNGHSKDHINGVNNYSSLSSEAPEFSPTSHKSMDDADTFPDEHIENLVIVVRKPGYASPVHPLTSRVMSNGSIDFASLRQGNGEKSATESSNGSAIEEPLTNGTNGTASPSKKNNMPVFWVKDRDAPIDLLPDNLTHESYNIFRVRALENRHTAANVDCHKDMDVMYQFWSHFLVHNFNSSMYNEFRAVSLDDAHQRDSLAGFYNLIRFYEAALKGPKTVNQQVAQDFVNLVQAEPENTNRYGFHKLRTIWTDSSLNLKNRKKVDSSMSSALKAELEQ